MFGFYATSKGVFGILGEDANYEVNQQALLLWGRCGGRGEESQGKPKELPRQAYGNLRKLEGNLETHGRPGDSKSKRMETQG